MPAWTTACLPGRGQRYGWALGRLITPRCPAVHSAESFDPIHVDGALPGYSWHRRARECHRLASIDNRNRVLLRSVLVVGRSAAVRCFRHAGPGCQGGLTLAPPVHRQRDEVRPVLEVAEDHAALPAGAAPGGGEPQRAPAVGAWPPQAWRACSSRLPQEAQILTISHRPPGGDQSPQCRPSRHIALLRILISAP